MTAMLLVRTDIRSTVPSVLLQSRGKSNGLRHDLPRPPQNAPASKPKFSGRIPNAHPNLGPQFPSRIDLPSRTGLYQASRAPAGASDSTGDISQQLSYIGRYIGASAAKGARAGLAEAVSARKARLAIRKTDALCFTPGHPAATSCSITIPPLSGNLVIHKYHRPLAAIS